MLPFPTFNRVAYGLKLSPNQIGTKRAKLTVSDHGIFPLSPAAGDCALDKYGTRRWCINGYHSSIKYIIMPISCGSCETHTYWRTTWHRADWKFSASDLCQTHSWQWRWIVGDPIPALESCTDEDDQPPPLMESGDGDENDGNKPPPSPSPSMAASLKLFREDQRLTRSMVHFL